MLKNEKMTLEKKEAIRLQMIEKWKDPQYRQHMSDVHKGQKTWASNNFKKGMTTNTGRTHFRVGQYAEEKHLNWQKDNVSYTAIHKWIAKKLGKPSKCEECRSTKAKRFEWANISGEYKRDIKDWKRLCSVCHANEHKNWEARWLVSQ